MMNSNSFPSIGLDIDGVLANFVEAAIRRAQEMGLDGFHDHYTLWNHWKSLGDFEVLWEAVKDDASFWLEEIQPIQKAHVPYPVTAYVTRRGAAPDGVTTQWLEQHGFPEAPVHVVNESPEKIDVLQRLRREVGLDVFVDDKPPTVRDIEALRRRDPDSMPAGLLMTTPANSRFSNSNTTGLPRVDYLPEVPHAYFALLSIEPPSSHAFDQR